ncbi:MULTISPECIES: peptidoglycan-binding domain-containing protein [Cyanophyceae]|uniref:Peptidoglycan-binding protein n=1 Tax=Nodularia spumigena CENA596 TaxID=1819295 RepID=A0A161VMI9_NODSP|nr:MULTISPECIES: peptidoglycan-binding domain-containing protein [Cyanophyceae]MDB9357955.1 peptidoglycan-binding domain-containing protein [Nodularia spumigena CS-587/03]KZL48005.1 peptidoglycan-binding protein [Nodularia spumigena CENA596]MDB9305118.1 peptidoglycan-binding domain-containing protein [Nodularia spumigena CS-591/12]MDB9317995.1 peptidoglycan-binding domain-containing protein [Nodularia spumigena CS-590/01A]MDB9322572.1 peptidoglycan-binding domain-containing protein [Nodularia 
MSEIGLLITGILTARQLSLPNKLPKQQPFQMENSSERLTQSNVTQLARNSQITPPEFIPTEEVFLKTSSASQTAKDKLLDKIRKKHLSPGSLTLAKNHYTQAKSQNGIKVAARSSPRFSGPSLPTLRFGSSGTSVRVLQRLLVSNGYAIRVDGAFGPLTETAVKAFQNQRSLGVDGIVGPVTWQQLTI